MNAATEFASLSPMRRVLIVAERMVTDAERAGIAISPGALSDLCGVTIYADDPDDTPALAAVLNLPHESFMDCPDDDEKGVSAIDTLGGRQQVTA